MVANCLAKEVQAIIIIFSQPLPEKRPTRRQNTRKQLENFPQQTFSALVIARTNMTSTCLIVESLKTFMSP